MKTTILSVVLSASATFARPQPGLPFLLIWPTARSTALAGAVTGLAHDPDAPFFNPAGLAFQDGIGATASYADWLPGLYPGMDNAYFAGTYALPVPPSSGKSVVIGLDMARMGLGRLDCYTVPPEYPEYVWDGALAAAVAAGLSEQLGLGLKVKVIHSQFVPDWVWKSMPELGIEAGGTGTTWAADVGALWKPSPKFSLGGCLANVGPGITYTSSGEHDPSPTILRMGACWTPLDSRLARVSLLPELDRVLVDIFYDSTHAAPFSQELLRELDGAWKALAVEVTTLRLITVRLGYFEDRDWQRGGFVFERSDMIHHYTLYDLLTRGHLGTLESIGLCWGFGIGYMNYLRLDVSSDAAIYDFDTSNWKFSLVANDIAGGIRELSQGHMPWEE